MADLEWANYLRTNRQKKGFTLRHLAQCAGVDASYLTIMERDGYVPRRDKVLAIAEALNIDKDRTLLEAGYAPSGISISTILEKSTLESAEDLLIPEMNNCLRELFKLTTKQQKRVTEFLTSIVSTMKNKENRRRKLPSAPNSKGVKVLP